MIVAQNLSRNFGHLVAVDSISFRIPSGRVVGFLGPNGAGKTTTIRMIAGYLTPSSGTIEVDGLDVVRHARRVRRRIGYLPESTPLYGEMRVVEYLRFRARLMGVPRRTCASAVDGAMRRCGLLEVRKRVIARLSKGFRQRVGLAAAIVHEPPVLILDEPMVGLDPAQIREVRGLIRELAGRHTILFSTHILPEAELVCDDVIVMAGGHVRVQGSVEELRDRAARGGRYVVETELATSEEVLSKLPSVQSVDAVTVGDGWTRMVITPVSNARDLRDLIGRTLRKHGSPIRELKREAPTLEHMFLELLVGADAAPLGSAGAAPARAEAVLQ
jgi:ABC-2 type transport system ATP-binding protein